MDASHKCAFLILIICLIFYAFIVMLGMSIDTAIIGCLSGVVISWLVLLPKQRDCVAGGKRPLSINIAQNGTVERMKMDCMMNDAGNEINCSTDTEFLYQHETLGSTIINTPIIGTPYKFAKQVVKIGVECADKILDQPFGSTHKNIIDTARDFHHVIKTKGAIDAFMPDNKGSSPMSNWLLG